MRECKSGDECFYFLRVSKKCTSAAMKSVQMSKNKYER